MTVTVVSRGSEHAHVALGSLLDVGGLSRSGGGWAGAGGAAGGAPCGGGGRLWGARAGERLRPLGACLCPCLFPGLSPCPAPCRRSVRESICLGRFVRGHPSTSRKRGPAISVRMLLAINPECPGRSRSRKFSLPSPPCRYMPRQFAGVRLSSSCRAGARAPTATVANVSAPACKVGRNCVDKSSRIRLAVSDKWGAHHFSSGRVSFRDFSSTGTARFGKSFSCLSSDSWVYRLPRTEKPTKTIRRGCVRRSTSRRRPSTSAWVGILVCTSSGYLCGSRGLCFLGVGLQFEPERPRGRTCHCHSLA